MTDSAAFKCHWRHAGKAGAEMSEARRPAVIAKHQPGGRRALEGGMMRSILTVLTIMTLAGAAAAHPGIGDGAVHDTMHALGGVELLLAALAVGAVFGVRRLRSRRIRRK